MAHSEVEEVSRSRSDLEGVFHVKQSVSRGWLPRCPSARPRAEGHRSSARAQSVVTVSAARRECVMSLSIGLCAYLCSSAAGGSPRQSRLAPAGRCGSGGPPRGCRQSRPFCGAIGSLLPRLVCRRGRRGVTGAGLVFDGVCRCVEGVGECLDAGKALELSASAAEAIMPRLVFVRGKTPDNRGWP